MAPRFRLSQRKWREIQQMPQVRAALAGRAARIAARANQINNAEDVDADIHVEAGTRPQGRAYSRVVSTDAEGEYGNETTLRRRVLGRAARS
ncbi:hypothetical protein PV646_28800 [Streptomyces sp. ID05-26A]|nr:hypothetical protein [Streptomyces sp. ID05-26A]